MYDPTPEFDSDDDEPPINVIDDEALGVYKVVLPEMWARHRDAEDDNGEEERRRRRRK